MKKAIILLVLVLSALIFGCTATQQNVTETKDPTTETAQLEAIQEIDNNVLSEDGSIEIGEMI